VKITSLCSICFQSKYIWWISL